MRARQLTGAVAGGLTMAVAALAGAPQASATPQVSASSNAAHIVVVHAGASIQAAIDAAQPDTTITVEAGSYRENLLITKPVTLRGEGHVQLLPPATPVPNRCTEDEDAGHPLQIGICILGVLGGPADSSGDLPSVITPVRDVHVSGMEINHFDEAIESDGTDGMVISSVTAHGNSGMDFFYGTGTVLIDLDVSGSSGYASAALQRSQGVRVVHSRFTGNDGFGLALTDTSDAMVVGNQLTGNSGGLAVVDSAGDGLAEHLTIVGNLVEDNTGYWPGDGEAPPVSGVGIALVGTRDAAVHGNRVIGNTPSADAPFGGFGIGLLDATNLSGGGVPTGNRIIGNMVAGSPVAVLYDGSGSDNVIRANHTP